MRNRSLKCDLLITDANVATMVDGEEPYGIKNNAAIAITDGQICWIGNQVDLPSFDFQQSVSVQGRWLTPGLIDCHTHLIFAGNRAREFEQRLNGVTYEEIARAGGGIRSTVNATREASTEILVQGAKFRVETLVAEGVSTIEVKSGYGLDLDTEISMLEAARALGEETQAELVTTFLGAHTVPEEFQGRAGEYIDFVLDSVLPIIHERELADAVDAYCENIAFSVDEVAKLFEQAQRLKIPIKLHADQLSQCGGAELAAAFNALSADHLEYTSPQGVQALADAGSVAVLLPGPFLVLGEKQKPPMEAFREAQVPIAIASDCNPGTSPICSLRMTMNLATSLFGLTLEETLAGVTRNAARALGLAEDRGTLEVSKRADIAVWDIGHPRELMYWAGLNQLNQLWIEGKLVES